MFNIGFFELIILAVIGLVVIGPEELPELARKAARLLNEFKRMGEGIISPVDDIKAEADRFLEKTRQELVADVINKKNQAVEEKLKDKSNENVEVSDSDAAAHNIDTDKAKKE
jgi:sec-independent protein translocase protein TatB